VLLDDEEEMWEFLGRLSEPESMVEYANLVLRRNAGLCGNVKAENIESAIENRLSIDVARKHAVYPPDLQYEGDNYKGSGGRLLERDEQFIPAGQKPFSLETTSHKTRVRMKK
jgi:hypothetical protein